jgi:hypothetical protein
MKIPVIIIPILIVTLAAAGLGASYLIRIPTAVMAFQENNAGTKTHQATYLLRGVSCRDLALTACGNLSGTEGIYKATAYASHNRIDVLYDPERISPNDIGGLFENPVYIKETGEYVFNMFKVIQIDDKQN